RWRGSARRRPAPGSPDSRSRAPFATLERMIPWIFLAVSVWGAVFTWVAIRPPQRPRWLNVAVFFARWLTSELALHHVAWQRVATLAFAWAGALAAWPGWLGLAITLASWAGLFASPRAGPGGEAVAQP